MHIVFFADNFPPEGNAIASRVFERACYWIKWGHQVTVITSVPNFPEGKVYPGYKNKLYQVELIEGIRVVRVKTYIAQNKGFLLRILDFVSYICPALIAGILQKKPDVIVATTPQFFVGITAWLASFFRGIPFILEVADIWPASIVGVGAMHKSILIRGLEKLELFLYRRATSIIVLTPAFKKNLTSRNIPENKITVVINGVELAKYTPLEKDTLLAAKLNIDIEKKFIVGYIGTHGMAHALKNVLQAAESLSNSNILLLFVGAGSTRDELIAYATKKQLNNVKFVSAQPKKSISSVWSLCDVALVHLKNDPVFAEVIPSKIFEAMGMGLPILLAAPKGEASEIVTQQKVGIWVPAEEPQALADAINLLYNEVEKRKQFAIRSRECAYFYSRERQAREMMKAIEDALSNKQHVEPKEVQKND